MSLNSLMNCITQQNLNTSIWYNLCIRTYSAILKLLEIVHKAPFKSTNVALVLLSKFSILQASLSVHTVPKLKLMQKYNHLPGPTRDASLENVIESLLEVKYTHKYKYFSTIKVLNPFSLYMYKAPPYVFISANL